MDEFRAVFADRGPRLRIMLFELRFRLQPLFHLIGSGKFGLIVAGLDAVGSIIDSLAGELVTESCPKQFFAGCVQQCVEMVLNRFGRVEGAPVRCGGARHDL